MSSNIQVPTDEQQNAIAENGNIVITAKPGSGKTYTIIEKIKKISDTIYDYQGVIAISFTRKASQELSLRAKKKGINTRKSFFGTIDSFYISEIIIPFAKFLTRNLNTLEVCTTVNDYPVYKELSTITTGVNKKNEEMLLRSLSEGLIFLDISGETAFYIIKNVKECIEYLKAKYTHIFTDEYQDCGDIQHKIFMELVANEIVGVAVGDLDQAIYAFSNRYSKYLSSLISNPQFTHYQLSRNHRCHKSISDYSLRLMGGRPSKVDDMRVIQINVAGCEKEIMQTIDNKLPEIMRKYGVENKNEIAILCKSNGTAEKCNEFLSTPSKLFVDTELDRFSAYWARLFRDFLQSYYDKDIFNIDFVEKYLNSEYEPKKYQKVLSIIDRLFDTTEENLKNEIEDIVNLATIIYPEYENHEIVDLMVEILNNKDMLEGFKPASVEEICVLTLHKSKGLEYKVVFLMDLYKWVYPFEDCSEEDYNQSLNLHYVGITRAIEVCYIMQGTQRYRARYKDYYKAEESPFLHLNGLNDFRRITTWEKK